MIRVVKKDGSKEEFNVQKIIVAVNKSAYRALIKFTPEELDFICKFVEQEIEKMGIDTNVSMQEVAKKRTSTMQDKARMTASGSVNTSNRQYKKGSIGAYANMLNNSGDKENK